VQVQRWRPLDIVKGVDMVIKHNGKYIPVHYVEQTGEMEVKVETAPYTFYFDLEGDFHQGTTEEPGTPAEKVSELFVRMADMEPPVEMKEYANRFPKSFVSDVPGVEPPSIELEVEEK
jgi:hypothetical protein